METISLTPQFSKLTNSLCIRLSTFVHAFIFCVQLSSEKITVRNGDQNFTSLNFFESKILLQSFEHVCARIFNFCAQLSSEKIEIKNGDHHFFSPVFFRNNLVKIVCESFFAKLLAFVHNY